MKNRLKVLYDEYMSEKESEHCETAEHQEYMKNLAMEMAAVEYLMTTPIDEHIGKHVSSDHMRLTDMQMKEWVKSIGEHWSIEQTTAVGKQLGIDFSKYSEMCFYVVMNMLYSDYSKAWGEEPSIYVKSANAFLLDSDSYSPKEKLARYYKYIVKH